MMKSAERGEGRCALPIKLSYINARGEEAILDDDEGSFAHELIGREGFEFPSLNLAEHDYGNGSTDIVAITVKNREVTCYFWADVMDIPHWEDKFDEVKAILLQTGQKENEWGKLKIRVDQGRDTQDGKRSHYVYLNCVYSKGLDTLVRDNMSRVKFSLTFKATEPYFYDGYQYSVITKAEEAGFLYMNKAQIFTDLAKAREYSGYVDDGSGNNSKYYFQIPNSIPTQFYAFSKDETLYFGDAKLCNTQTEARNITGESSAGNSWWGVSIDGESKYYARKDDTTLFLQSSESSSLNDIYIMAEKVYPEIYIHGPAENISLINNTTGRKIVLEGSISLTHTQSIKIVTAPFKRSIKRGSTNLIPYLSIDSTLDWYLAHGNNEIEFNNSATTPESYVKFTYTERRSSVV